MEQQKTHSQTERLHSPVDITKIRPEPAAPAVTGLYIQYTSVRVHTNRDSDNKMLTA